MNVIKKCVNLFIYSYNLMGDILKKIFETIGLLSLICFSFFCTNEISMVIRENDDILKQIKQVQSQYKIEPINAVIEGNTIIPGVSGSKIDVMKSYKKMKKINSFNDNLLIYEDIKPEISVNNVYDKYIVSGNKTIKEVSLLFVVKENDDISDVLSILEEHGVEATFFLDSYWFENNNELAVNIFEAGHIIGTLGYSEDYNSSSINWMNSVIKKLIKQKSTYCYVINNDEVLNMCSKIKSYTITPNIVVENNPFIEIKQQLTNGSIISLNINNNVIKELPLILDYIDSKGYEMVNIENLIDE